MNGAANIIRAIGSLWPLALLAIALWFRQPIGATLSALGKGMRLLSVKAGWFEFVFEEKVSEVRASLERTSVVRLSGGGGTTATGRIDTVPDPDSLAAKFGALATENPGTAILLAHAHVESILLLKLTAAGENVDAASQGANQLARRAVERGLISEKVVPAVEGITAIRNLAQHSTREVTKEQADEYLALADGVLYAMSQPPR